MNKCIENEKEIERITNLVKANRDIIEDLYYTFYDEEITDIEDIEIYNVRKHYNNFKKEVEFTLSIKCCADNKVIDIQECVLSYDLTTKEMYYNELLSGFMDIDACEFQEIYL